MEHDRINSSSGQTVAGTVEGTTDQWTDSGRHARGQKGDSGQTVAGTQ